MSNDIVKVAEEHVDQRRGIDHIGAGVACIIHDGEGRILLMKRGPKARDENGRWDVCGGAIEFGESIDSAIKREINEELCASTLEIKFICVYDAHRKIDDNTTHWIQLVHAVRVSPDDIKIGEPHKIDEIGWFTSKNLPEPLHSQFHKSFDEAVRQGYVK